MNSKHKTRKWSDCLHRIATVVLTLVLSTGIPLLAQDAGLSIDLQNAPLSELIEHIERQSDCRFFYESSSVDTGTRVSVKAENASIDEILSIALRGSGITHSLSGARVLLSTVRDGATGVGGQIIVTGTVTDEDGEPVIAAGVVEEGTANGVVTGLDGRYSIEVSSPSALLEFSCIGYRTRRVPVAGRGAVDVTLAVEASFLEEAVAIGYGTQRKGDVTSSVQSVKSDEFNKGAVIDAGQLIQGKVAGLQVNVSSGDPTSSSSVMLRGYSSLLGSTEPLVLIDGVPGSFATVVPEDIESIDVLKDGSATAIYGTRGTNGVIIITTKNATREMPTTVQYSGYISVSKWVDTPDFLKADDLRELLADGWSFVGGNSSDLGQETDWFDEIGRTAISHNHNLSIRGGSKHSTYTANLSYKDNQGTIKGTGMTDIHARVAVSQYLFDDKVKLSAEVLANEKESNTGFDPKYVYRLAVCMNPTQPPKRDDGSWYELDVNDYNNPVSYLEEKKGMDRWRNVRFNGSVEYSPFESLKITGLYVRKGESSIGGRYYTHQDVTTTKSGENGYASRNASEYVYNLAQLSADYHKDFGKHHITAVAGYSYEDNTTESFSMSNHDFPSDSYLYNNMELGKGLSEGTATETSNKYTSKLIGLFARATYNYDDRYLAMVSIRRDGSSKFGEAHKWGNFPGVSLGWRMNNEKFMRDVRWVSNLKLRAGFGITGIDVNDPYQSLASLNYNGYYLAGTEWVPLLYPVRNDNPDLQWEKKYEYNVGLDFTILSGRIGGSIDLYQRDTKDGLYEYSVPSPPYQYTSMMANAAHIRNSGVEVLINATPVQKGRFSWNTSYTFSYNKNKLVSLSPPKDSDLLMSSDYFDTGYSGSPISTTTHRVKEGWPIGNFFGLKSVGLSSSGKWVVEVLDEDGNISYDLAENADNSDWQVLGNGVPKVNMTWNNTINYKNWDLQVTMRGAFGFQLLNFMRMYYENPTIQFNMLKSAFDPKPVVDVATGQKTGETTTLSDSQRFVSDYIEDGDYWKIDNLTIGHTLHFKGKYVKDVRLYGTVHNLATISGYSGLDPEVRVAYGTNGYDPGTDEREKYPTIRSFTFGAIVTF